MIQASVFFSVAFFIYVVCGICYSIAYFKAAPRVGWFGWCIGVVGMMVYTAGLVTRVMISKHPPFSNLYESLIFFSWSFMLFYLWAEKVWKIYRLGFFAIFFNLSILVYAFSHDPSIKPLMPALQSNWMLLHVTSCFLAYGAFAVSFLASLLYLTPIRKTISRSEELDQVIYRLILFGFPLLSLGVASGAVWANEAWGVYWGWDPKETWALITWFIYALYLHLRLLKGWQGNKLAWVSLLGFVSVIFTYLGVSYLMSGLHSYA